MAWSNSAHGRVEEDARREVGVAPLRERRLLLEVLLQGREILHIHRVVADLICSFEVLAIERDGMTFLRVSYLLLIANVDRLCTALGSRLALIEDGEADEATRSLRALLLRLDSWRLVA